MCWIGFLEGVHIGGDMLDRFCPEVLEMLRSMLAEAEIDLVTQLGQLSPPSRMDANNVTRDIGKSFMRKAWAHIQDKKVLRNGMRPCP